MKSQPAPKQEPTHLDPCVHCKYTHFKRSGHVKWYIGALQCPIYVEFLLDEAETWGKTSRRPPEHGRELKLAQCNAPDEYVCYHKGSVEGGRRRCYSPDGFPTHVPEDRKLVLLTNANGDVQFDVNAKLWCPHIGPYRRSPVEKTGPRIGSKGGRGTPTRDHFNAMPDTHNPRKTRVYQELWRRVDHLRTRGERATPEAIALLGGHANWG